MILECVCVRKTHVVIIGVNWGGLRRNDRSLNIDRI